MFSRKTWRCSYIFENGSDARRIKNKKGQARAAGEDTESFWLSLRRTIVEDKPPFDSEEE